MTVKGTALISLISYTLHTMEWGIVIRGFSAGLVNHAGFNQISLWDKFPTLLETNTSYDLLQNSGSFCL